MITALIAQATQPTPADFTAGLNTIVGCVVALLAGGAALLTAIAALLGVVHINGKVGAVAAKAAGEANAGANLLAHVGEQVNAHGSQIVSLASTGIGKTLASTLESSTPLKTLETLAGTLVEPPQASAATPSKLPGIVGTAVLLLALVIPTLAGCTALQSIGQAITGTSATTPPKVQVAQLETEYSGITNALVGLRKAGTIKAGSSLDTSLKEADNAAYAALVQMREAVAAGEPLPADALSAFSAALTALKTGQSNALHTSTTNP